jgi:hypothetical protein
MTGIQDRQLFPSLEELAKGNSALATYYSYDSILEDFKYLCIVILKKDVDSPEGKQMIIGTHMLRKTAFLFAHWGKCNYPEWRGKLEEFDEASMLLDARHKDICSTKTYLGDSATLKALLKRINADDVMQKVGRYDPIFVKTLDNFASLSRASGDLSSKLNSKSLHEVADWYVFLVLKIDRESFQGEQFTVAQIVEHACTHKPSVPENKEPKYKAILKEKLNIEEYETVLQEIKENQEERVLVAVNHLGPADLPSGIVIVSDKQKAKGGPPDEPMENIVAFQKDYRKEVNMAKSKAETIFLLVSAAKELQKQVRDGKVLKDPLKSWAYRAGKIAQCVEICHSGNIAQFLDKTKNFRLGKWACCKGVKHVACFDRSKFE